MAVAKCGIRKNLAKDYGQKSAPAGLQGLGGEAGQTPILLAKSRRGSLTRVVTLEAKPKRRPAFENLGGKAPTFLSVDAPRPPMQPHLRLVQIQILSPVNRVARRDRRSRTICRRRGSSKRHDH